MQTLECKNAAVFTWNYLENLRPTRSIFLRWMKNPDWNIWSVLSDDDDLEIIALDQDSAEEAYRRHLELTTTPEHRAARPAGWSPSRMTSEEINLYLHS